MIVSGDYGVELIECGYDRNKLLSGGEAHARVWRPCQLEKRQKQENETSVIITAYTDTAHPRGAFCGQRSLQINIKQFTNQDDTFAEEEPADSLQNNTAPRQPHLHIVRILPHEVLGLGRPSQHDAAPPASAQKGVSAHRTMDPDRTFHRTSPRYFGACVERRWRPSLRRRATSLYWDGGSKRRQCARLEGYRESSRSSSTSCDQLVEIASRNA